jgi:hypothetical protein
MAGAVFANIINFSWGDGSVRSITTNIDMKIFQYLATIGNGEAVTDN